MKKIKLNKRDIVALMLLATIIVAAFAYVLNKSLQEHKFANQMENLYAKNEKPVFCLDKIIMYSSANAIDNSEGKTMQDLNVCQFTDIAIYIDNMADIKALVKDANAMNVSTVTTDDEASREIKEHTIKELYIDNIEIKPVSSKGKKTFAYKSRSSFGKFKTIIPNVANDDNDQVNNQNDANNQSKINNQNVTNIQNDVKEEIISVDEQPERIDFDIISTNIENERSDYTKPTLYADCSDPITLNYMNKNIVTGYAVSTQDTQIKFDGSILKSVAANLDDLACAISFDIHMKNNLGQNFTCGVGIDIPLKNENKSIYDGYMYVMQDNLQNKYKFFKS